MRKKVSKIRMEWCLYNNCGKQVRINIGKIEQEDYERNYKGKLTCIEGCEARIKFTQRKNGKKFLSTWNKEGNKHNEDCCPYHINYKGVIGRKKLKEIQEKVHIPDDKIQESLTRKIKNYLKEFNEEDIPKGKLSTRVVVDTGEGKENTKIDDEQGMEGQNNKSGRIKYMEVETINEAYVDLSRGVIGIADNVQIGDSKNGEEWHYINLKNRYNKTSIYFPSAYYEGDKDRFNELEKVLRILKEKLENEIENRVVIAAYGQIKLKKGSGNDYNINIINPKHIIINGITMNKILVQGKIDDISIDKE